jgi:hypothetical protein
MSSGPEKISAIEKISSPEKISDTTNEILHILDGLRPQARLKYRACIKGVFGSCARGQDVVGSDIDVLVEFDDGASLIDLVGLSNFLEEHLHRPVDVVPESAVREELKDAIMKDAVYI